MKIVVCGSRDWTNPEPIRRELKAILDAIYSMAKNLRTVPRAQAWVDICPSCRSAHMLLVRKNKAHDGLVVIFPCPVTGDILRGVLWTSGQQWSVHEFTRIKGEATEAHAYA